MKKIISFLMVAVMVVGVMFSMVSCSGDIEDGIYKADDGRIYEIDGGKLIIKTDKGSVEYKYEVDEDKLICTFDKTDVEEWKETYADSTQEFSFKTIENGFELDGYAFRKQ